MFVSTHGNARNGTYIVYCWLLCLRNYQLLIIIISASTLPTAKCFTNFIYFSTNIFHSYTAFNLHFSPTMYSGSVIITYYTLYHNNKLKMYPRNWFISKYFIKMFYFSETRENCQNASAGSRMKPLALWYCITFSNEVVENLIKSRARKDQETLFAVDTYVLQIYYYIIYIQRERYIKKPVLVLFSLKISD